MLRDSRKDPRENVGHVREDATRMLRGRYEKTSVVELSELDCHESKVISEQSSTETITMSLSASNSTVPSYKFRSEGIAVYSQPTEITNRCYIPKYHSWENDIHPSKALH